MATKLTDLHSVEQVLAELTLEEKARLVIGGSPFHTKSIPEHGIPGMYMIDSCNGLNTLEYAGERIYMKLAADAEAAGQPLDREKNGYMGGLLLALSTLQKMAAAQAQSGASPAPKLYSCYPPGIALGSTWNPEVVEACGVQLAREMSSYGIDMVLGPNVNIHRDPLCGRLGESFSEDPFLVSKLGPAMVRGIQNQGIVACAKHFAANNQEKDRMGVEEHIPERALREIYLPGFKACVDAGCKTIMSAYNKINGTPSAQNKWLLTDILRDEWGFEGFVVSDWGAAYDQIQSITAGTDLTMPGPRGIKCIIEAVENGTLPEETLNQCVRNILNVVVSSTAMTGKRLAFDRAEALDIMENALRESMILLKNDGTLPLQKDISVAFYGKRCKVPTICSAGSSNVSTDLTTNPFDSTVALLGAENVTFGHSTPNTRYWIAVVGCDGREGADREDLFMDSDDIAALEQAITESNAAGGKVIMVLNSSGPVDLTDYENRVNAILCPFFGGIQMGKIIVEAIWGLFNPSGKLAITWPRHNYDRPAYKNFGGENKEVWYSEGIYVGYRWYDARHIEPAYPFGYGLSYTTFAITDAKVPAQVNVDKEMLTVAVTVKNTGTLPGSEVIQLYVRDVECKFDRPEKELKAFQKLYLQPGEEKTITLSVGKSDLAGYYMEFGEWITQPGDFDLLIGTSSRDIAITERIKVLCKDPFGWNERTPIGVIAQNPQAVQILNHIMEDDILQLAKVAIDFAPDKSIGELWGGTNIQGALKAKGWSNDVITEKLQIILSEFEMLPSSK